ncbi:MAG: DUF4142 domain-containing protein [Rhizomicrobium sp.]
MSLKICLLGAALFAAVAISPALGQAAPPTPNVPATRATISSSDFVTRAAVTDRYEIAAARIAEKRSHDSAIDRFAARMIAEHGRNSTELRSLAKRIGGLRLPARLDEQHKGLIEQLKAVDRKQFDTTYAQQQIQGHRDAIALFTGYSRHGDNPKLRQFANATLPVLEHHLHMAQALPVGPRVAGGR